MEGGTGWHPNFKPNIPKIVATSICLVQIEKSSFVGSHNKIVCSIYLFFQKTGEYVKF